MTYDINPGPVTPDFDGSCRGWQAYIVIDPEERHVWLYAGIGPGMPAPVWHRRMATVSVNSAASGEHLLAALRANEATIDTLCDAYQGDGEWGDDADTLLAALHDALSDVATYWAAGDWMASEADTITDEAVGAALRGRLDAYIDDLVATGASDDCLLDRGDVERAIMGYLTAARQCDPLDEEVWVVTHHHAEAATDDTVLPPGAELGETWWIVEADSALCARAWAALLGHDGAAREARRICDVYDYPELEQIIP